MKNLGTSISIMLKDKHEQRKAYYGKVCMEDVVKQLFSERKVVFCDFLETECGVVLEILGYWRTIKISPTHLIISTAIPQ